jgi:NTP pyrophosphatase (non-canonical NTP hydrolase)
VILDELTDCVDRHARGNADLLYAALKLAAESGEVTAEVANARRKGQAYDRVKIALEVGDVLWYLERICQEIGIPLSVCVALVVHKLERRVEHGKDAGAEYADACALIDLARQG